MRGKGRKWESIVGKGREGRKGSLRGGEKVEEIGGIREGIWQGRVRQVRGLGERNEWWDEMRR